MRIPQLLDIILRISLVIWVSPFAYAFPGKDSVSRVLAYRNHISLAGHLTQINLEASLSDAQNRNRIGYRTETATRLGISFDYRWLGFELFTRLPVENTVRKGRTENSGIYPG